MRVEIVTATEAHASALADNLRQADADEITAAGFDPRGAVMASWRRSWICRAALVDGRVAALWGVTGELLSGVGCPWLLTTAVCERVHPLRFARVYRDEALSMLALFQILENFVDVRYNAAVRMLQIAGFHLDEAKPYGLHGAPFRRFWMIVA